MLSRALITLSLVAVAAPVVFTSSSTGQAPAQIRFQAMDTNRDGAIAREEWKGNARSFQVHDWNGDGRLSGEEVRIGARRNVNWETADHNPSRWEQNLSWTAQAFTSLDHNRDGRLMANEWHFDTETFRRVDANRDNVLSRTEFLSGDDDARDVTFDDLDVNNNGRVERDEWFGSNVSFSALDRNRDGILSRFEVVGGRDTTGDTWDQFANLDYDRNGGLARNEWHWSATSFNQRDLDRNGILTRREYEATGGNAGAGSAAGTASGAGSQTVRVNSQVRWTDAVIQVRAGDVITFDSSGSITMSDNGADTASPAGSTTGRRAPDAPILNQLAGGLLARIDGYGPIWIGNRRTITAPVGGRLYLGVNDDHLPDNRGEFTVTVGVQGRTSR
jgi:Ca2+-binding EF-hand superfamily protein